VGYLLHIVVSFYFGGVLIAHRFSFFFKESMIVFNNKRKKNEGPIKHGEPRDTDKKEQKQTKQKHNTEN
jgi:hypothetical protein